MDGSASRRGHRLCRVALGVQRQDLRDEARDGDTYVIQAGPEFKGAGEEPARELSWPHRRRKRQRDRADRVTSRTDRQAATR